MTPEACAQLLLDSEKVAAMTGAGVSTAAGLPDFRGPEGLYVTRRYDPDRVFDIRGFLADPAPFFEFTRDFLAVVDDIEPTVTHRFLAQLEAAGRLRWLITQNIDALHQKAGSRNVISVHGDYWTASCLGCNAEYDFVTFRAKVDAENVPSCDLCAGVIKPDVVFFGEAVHGLTEAAAAIDEADLLFVLGSSLTVFPAATLPEIAHCPVVVVNRGPVGLSPGPDRYFVDADLDEFFAAVSERLP
jgi:NAD-dependent deacetylase